MSKLRIGSIGLLLIGFSSNPYASLASEAMVPIDDPSEFGGVRYRLGFDGGLASASLYNAVLYA